MNDRNKTKLIERAYRLPIRLLANFESTSFNGNYFIENLSSGGLFIATDKPLPVGEQIKIQFILPHNRRRHTVEARVAWTRTELKDNLVPGMGISFEGLDPQHELMLKKAILQYKDVLNG